MPRVAVVVAVLASDASFHFVVAETGAAGPCTPVDVLHPNRAALFSDFFLKFKFLVFFRFFRSGITWSRCHFSVLFSFLFPDQLFIVSDTFPSNLSLISVALLAFSFSAFFPHTFVVLFHFCISCLFERHNILHQDFKFCGLGRRG